MSTSVLYKKFLTDIRSKCDLLLLLISVFCFFDAQAQCVQTTAFTGAETVGNQAWQGRLGLVFSNSRPIIVNSLGAFDDGGDGLNRPITVGIVNDATGATVVGPITMSGTSDPLVGSFRMQNITPVTLPVGQYIIVAQGYGPGEQNGNTYGGIAYDPVIFNSASVLTNVGSVFSGDESFGEPTTPDGGAGRYHAGTFGFVEVTPIINITAFSTFPFLEVCEGSEARFLASAPAAGNANLPSVESYNWTFSNAPTIQNYGQIGNDGATFRNQGATWSVTADQIMTVDLNIEFTNGCTADANTHNILVTNDDPPVITCPIIAPVYLDPLLCSATVDFLMATAIDDCTAIPTVMQIDGPLTGSVFPVGTTVLTFLAVDDAGNSSTCTANVVVNEYQAPNLGCMPIQVSLDDSCEADITPTEVLTGYLSSTGDILLGCELLYDINIVDANGISYGSTLTASTVGKTLTYTITHLPTGFNCSNTITVEDKIAPTITCSDVTVNCLADLGTVGLPIVDDNCIARAVLVDSVFHVESCDPTYIGRVERTWKAVDNAGNESNTCMTTVYLLRSTPTGITRPNANPILECSSDYAIDDKGNGYPSPMVTGVPRLGSMNLFPMSQLNMVYCNALIDYTDVLLIDTPCKKRIMRTWEITEWWCSTAVNHFISMQMIDIVDSTAPMIPKQDNAVYTTDSRSCDATIELPRLDISDNCSGVKTTVINVTQTGTAVGFLGSNGGSITLPVGTNDVVYTATDSCGNQSTMSYTITVKDNTSPLAFCDQFATVSLKTNGYTEITASALDDGSYDECSAVTVQVQRMDDPCGFGQNVGWHDKVGFCCEDAGQSRMVALLVTDAGGYTNICMVTVNIQDKINPSLTCPGDITITDCLYTFDPSNADDYFGEATITDNCPSNTTLTESIDDQRTSCGVGNVLRTFTLTQNGQVYGTCTQTITFQNNDKFYINSLDPNDGNDDVVWPKDFEVLGQCTFNGLLPETLPDSSAMPIITEDACDLVGMRYEDLVFPFTTNGACYKIIRTWYVIDWCQKDTDGNHLTWSYEQEIKVTDNDAPSIMSSSMPRIQCTYDGECLDGYIQLDAAATDCTPTSELKWSYQVYQDGQLYSSGSGNDASGTYPVGEYEIEFEVEDRCGNVSTTGYTFEVRNCKAPTAVCIKLATSLTLMNVNGSDTALVMVTPEMFDNKSYHVCGYPLLLSFSADTTDKLRTFGCDNIGDQDIELWVTDVNGNTSVCTTHVNVQDSFNLCGSLRVNIGGKIIKMDQSPLENVSIDLEGTETDAVVTDGQGVYVFPAMPEGGTYRVVPHRDGHDDDGVSTLDIVKIQRHILGIELLDSPYKILAADVSNSASLSASDLVDLRKLVLGINTEFKHTDSWRFVDANHNFVDAMDPWNGVVPEMHHIDALNKDMQVDFVGIKMGDVTNDAGQSHTERVSGRTHAYLSIENKAILYGELVRIPVYGQFDTEWYGAQIELEMKDAIIRNISSGQLNIDETLYSVLESPLVRIMHTMPEGMIIDADMPLFYIEIEATTSAMLSEMLALSYDWQPEIYLGPSQEIHQVDIRWTDAEQTVLTAKVIPNPWKDNTQLVIEIPAQGDMTIVVRDLMGREVYKVSQPVDRGTQVVNLNKTDILGAGIYSYEVYQGEHMTSGKMIVID